MRKGAALNLVFKSSVFMPSHDFCVAWAVVESAVIEKSLPALNEMGVGRLVLVYADLSQKNVRLDLQRMERILINSSQPCGRNSIMQIEVLGGSDELVQRYENVSLIDFGGKNIDIFGGDEQTMGCEIIVRGKSEEAKTGSGAAGSAYCSTYIWH